MEWNTFIFFSRDSYQGRKSNFYQNLPHNLKEHSVLEALVKAVEDRTFHNGVEHFFSFFHETATRAVSGISTQVYRVI